MHYESKHWNLDYNRCTLHGLLTDGVRLATKPACPVCVEENHPDLKGLFPTQFSEDSPWKMKMMRDSYYDMVKIRLERKKLWRALIYWSTLDTFISFFEAGGQTEKQCVRAIRRAFRSSDKIIYKLVKDGMAKDVISGIFEIVLYGILQDHPEADIMERVKCSPRSKVL